MWGYNQVSMEDADMNMLEKIKVGEKAPGFLLKDVEGKPVALEGLLKANKAVVVLFICNHCPYVQAYIPRLVKMQKELAGKGAVLVGINSNDWAAYPEDAPEKMKTYASQWGLNFAYLHDGDQTVADAYGANRTPEIFVLDGQGVVRYEGGIDDCYQDEKRVTRRPLLDAVNDLLAGREVGQTTSYAIGCSLKRKK
jgi:peroxiredoxin